MDHFDKLIQEAQNKNILYKSSGYTHPKPKYLKGYIIGDVFFTSDEFNKITHEDYSMFGT